MNKERIRQIRDVLERGETLRVDGVEVGFNMGQFITDDVSKYPDRTGHHCGTVGCVAGYAVLMFKEDVMLKDYLAMNIEDVSDEAADLLGLSDEEADDLFLGGCAPDELSRMTPQEAAQHVADFLEFR